MAVSKMNAEQLRWQAEDDANTMARYDEIISDAKRRKAAISAAKSRANELNRRARAMTNVSNYGSKVKRK